MLAALIETLRAEGSLERLAEATLRALLETVQRALSESHFDDARALRAMLHLRPEAGYAGLNVLEAGARALSAPGEDEALLPSATVWAILQASGRAVAVDVGMRSATPAGGERQAVEWGQGETQASAQRLLERKATHLYMLPLWAPGGLVGMLSVEAACLSAMGQPFVWDRCAEHLALVSALAGPYLMAAKPAAAEEDALATRVDGDPLLPVVGERMAPVVQVLRAFAGAEETLLIRGETGTGKSRLAKWVHANSERAGGPFEVLDLLSVPDETQLGELFGWRRGAFTGAVSDHAGAVARAEGGSLFLDEIDKLSLRAQAGLLTLLEERSYRALGDRGTPRTADLRFIVGTNVDLANAVREGRFREDLYYRINVLPVGLPPLRERSDELLAWAEFMLRRQHKARGAKGPVMLDEGVGAGLARHTWPGNLRELDNVLRRAYTLAAMEAPEAVIVQPEHLTAALGVDLTAEHPTGVVSSMAEAAAGLATRLHRGEAEIEGADVPAAFSGLLLAALMDLDGRREEAFRLAGRGALVRNRNHHKALKREAARAVELCHALGEAPPLLLRRLLTHLEGEGSAF